MWRAEAVFVRYRLFVAVAIAAVALAAGWTLLERYREYEVASTFGVYWGDCRETGLTPPVTADNGPRPSSGGNERSVVILSDGQGGVG